MAVNTTSAAVPSGRSMLQSAGMRTLRAAGVVGGFAQSLTGATGSLLAFEVTGSQAAAGLPMTATVAGAGAAAALSSRLVASYGRRRALSSGAGVAVFGSVLVGLAALTSSLALVLAGCALLGAGTAMVMLCRYAAAELVPEALRPRAMASVLGATTIGAVAGPNLLAPMGAAAAGLGLPELSGPFGFGALAFGCTAALLFAGLGDDRPGPEAVPASGGEGASALPGLLVLSVSNLVMIGVMTMAPVHMEHRHGGGLAVIGLVISIHVAGMFAPSTLSGRLVQRFGPSPMAMVAGVSMCAACALAAAGAASPWTLGVAMAALGVSWNLALVAGSAMLTAAAPRRARLKREGLGEVGMSIAAATAGLACGPLAAQGGYALVAIVGAAAAVLIPATIALRP
ncbi:MFS transporter [Glycomyces sp. NPDC046736]|uniref:MFS transporter n=1 Tax=Glycomyces sp. NPDC046736 TaxID=3155615 RepID=UPI0033FA09F5